MTERGWAPLGGRPHPLHGGIQQLAGPYRREPRRFVHARGGESSLDERLEALAFFDQQSPVLAGNARPFRERFTEDADGGNRSP